LREIISQFEAKGPSGKKHYALEEGACDCKKKRGIQEEIRKRRDPFDF